jgi:hypothetical protein
MCNVMKLYGRIAGIVVLVLLVPNAAFCDMSLGLTPMKLQLSVTPGKTSTKAIEIYNRGDEPAIIKVYVQDWVVRTNGEMAFLPARTLKNSASSWVDLSHTQFSLYPGESRLVRMSVTVPEDVQGTHWCIVFFEGIRQKPNTPLGVGVGGRLGTTLYVTASGTENRAATITALSATRGETGKGADFATTFANLGNVHFYPEGMFRVVSKEGDHIFESDLPKAVSLPGMLRDYHVSCNHDFAPGTYKLTVTFDYGAEELLQGETEFTVPAFLSSVEANAEESE